MTQKSWGKAGTRERRTRSSSGGIRPCFLAVLYRKMGLPKEDNRKNRPRSTLPRLRFMSFSFYDGPLTSSDDNRPTRRTELKYALSLLGRPWRRVKTTVSGKSVAESSWRTSKSVTSRWRMVCDTLPFEQLTPLTGHFNAFAEHNWVETSVSEDSHYSSVINFRNFLSRRK